MTFLLAILLVSLSYASLSHAPVSNSGVFYSYCITHFLHTHTHTHTRLTALFHDYPGELVPER